MIRRCAFSVGIAFVTAFAALAVLAFAATRADDPRKIADLFGIIAFLAGACAAGVCASVLIQELPLAGAALCGAVYAVAVLTVSLFWRSEVTRPFWQSAVCYAVGIALSAGIGLIFQTRRTTSRKTRKNLIKKMGRK